MTVREYIGARYVPLFMGQWNDENAYEPLSIVEYQGNSYTSRQAVPIGIEITNTLYWALTGNYNAQIEQYRQQVANYVQDVDGYRQDVINFETSFNNALDAFKQTGTTGHVINIAEYDNIDTTGVEDSTTAIQAIIDDAPSNSVILFEQGTYLISTLNLKPFMTYDFNGSIVKFTGRHGLSSIAELKSQTMLGSNYLNGASKLTAAASINNSIGNIFELRNESVLATPTRDYFYKGFIGMLGGSLSNSLDYYISIACPYDVPAIGSSLNVYEEANVIIKNIKDMIFVGETVTLTTSGIYLEHNKFSEVRNCHFHSWIGTCISNSYSYGTHIVSCSANLIIDGIREALPDYGAYFIADNSSSLTLVELCSGTNYHSSYTTGGTITPINNSVTNCSFTGLVLPPIADHDNAYSTNIKDCILVGGVGIACGGNVTNCDLYLRDATTNQNLIYIYGHGSTNNYAYYNIENCRLHTIENAASCIYITLNPRNTLEKYYFNAIQINNCNVDNLSYITGNPKNNITTLKLLNSTNLYTAIYNVDSFGSLQISNCSFFGSNTTYRTFWLAAARVEMENCTFEILEQTSSPMNIRLANGGICVVSNTIMLHNDGSVRFYLDGTSQWLVLNSFLQFDSLSNYGIVLASGSTAFVHMVNSRVGIQNPANAARLTATNSYINGTQKPRNVIFATYEGTNQPLELKSTFTEGDTTITVAPANL